MADSVTGTRYLVVIGSAETCLDISRCTLEQQYREDVAAEGRQGLRHLALAYRELARTDTADILALEKELTFLGFVTLVDPLRASTPHAIDTARQLGVGIKILTGDSAEVAAYVARRVGLLPEGDRVYAGDDLAQMAPDDFKRMVTGSSVFARLGYGPDKRDIEQRVDDGKPGPQERAGAAQETHRSGMKIVQTRHTTTCNRHRRRHAAARSVRSGNHQHQGDERRGAKRGQQGADDAGVGEGSQPLGRKKSGVCPIECGER